MDIVGDRLVAHDSLMAGCQTPRVRLKNGASIGAPSPCCRAILGLQGQAYKRDMVDSDRIVGVGGLLAFVRCFCPLFCPLLEQPSRGRLAHAIRRIDATRPPRAILAA